MNEQDARITRSRMLLIQSGMEMLSENRNASLSDIAQKAGVGRATLYRHFDAKEQLVKAIANECLQDFEHATSEIEKQAESWLDAVRLMFKAVMPLEKQLTFLMKLDILMDDDKELNKLFEQQQEELRQLVEACQNEKSIRMDVSPLWVLTLIEGLFFTAWQMVSQQLATHQQAADFAFETLCHGLKSG